MNLFRARTSPTWALPSAWVEGDHVSPRIDLVRKGHFVGEPRIFRDKPQDSLRHAFAVARSIADELDRN